MTDRRVSDLPYGQVGDCTYSLEQQSWAFARQFSYNYGIQPVDSSYQCLPPTLPTRSLASVPSHKAQENALNKRFPELIPAGFITSEVKKATPDDATSVQEALSTSSTLIGIGKAMDADNRNGSIIDIVALAAGKACEVLRLIRPQINKLGWPGHGNIHTNAMDPATVVEECYWAGNGGMIRQISFATECDAVSNWLASPSSWLAVRQVNSTTIFKPTYRRDLVPAIVPKDSALRYPPSRLTSNPITTLSIEKTGGLPHADVTFNPFYVRQFALIDQGGTWSVWDMEGKEGKSTFRIERSKHGRIHDDLEPNIRADIAGGWGRILWAGDVNTIIVCDRCHLAAFNIKAEPTRLPVPNIFISMSSGWILDVKQNVRQLNHLFVLTSARIFWLEIKSDGGYAGDVKILFSCRHFRDEDGENMKLDILSEESSCTLLLYSGRNALINTYRLSMSSDSNFIPECMDSSFVCKKSPGPETEENSLTSKTHSTAIIACEYVGTGTGPGSRYMEHDILFYQLFTLSLDLELTVTLCSTGFPLERNSAKYEAITAPTVKETKKTSRRFLSAIEADPFIVPDDINYDSDLSIESTSKHPHIQERGRSRRRGQRRPYAVDYHLVFEQLFSEAIGNVTPDESTPEIAMEGFSEFLQALPQRIASWKESEKNSLTTLHELAQPFSFSEDIDEVAAALGDIMANLSEDGGSESEKILTVSQINGTDPSLLTGKIQSAPDLMAVYRHLIDIWVTYLPRRTPGPVRLMKERLIRKIAADLALNSVAVSMRLPPVQKLDDVFDPDRMDLDRTTPFSMSQAEPVAESSQRRARSRSSTREPGLLTPAYTPSLISEGSAITEAAEDPAILLLRSYADFRSQPPNGATQSKIFSHWTSRSDPAQYSWEATKQANATVEDDDDDNASSQRERRRRKKRAEKMSTRYSRAGTSESASQPPPISYSQPSFAPSQPSFPTMYGSQPAFAPNMASSQVTRDMPMTQVEEGHYGGRQIFKKKKAKKRKQGF